MDQNIFLQVNTGIHTAQIYGLLPTPDGSHVVSFGADKTIRVWDPIAQKEVRQFRGRIGHGEDGRVKGIALTPDGRYLLSAVQSNRDQGNRLRVFDFQQQTLIRSLGIWGEISAIIFSPDGRYMGISDYTRSQTEIYDRARFFEDLDQVEPLVTVRYEALQGHPQRPQRIRLFEADGQLRLVSTLWELNASQHGLEIHWIDVAEQTSSRLHRIDCPNSAPESVAVNQAHIAFSYHHDRRITIVNHDGKPVAEYDMPSHPVELSYSPDGSLLLTGYRGDDGECFVLDVDNDYHQITHFFSHTSTCQAVCFLNNRTVVSGGGNSNELYFWYPRTGEIRGHIDSRSKTVFSVGVHDNLIAFGNSQVFKSDANNLAPLEQVVDLSNFDIFDIDEVSGVTFKRVNFQVGERTLEVRNANLWMNQVPLTGNNKVKNGHWYFAETFGFTEDGLVITGERRDGRIYVCHVDEGQGWAGVTYLATLQGHIGTVWDMVVDGDLLISCGADQIIRIWNLQDIPRPQTVDDWTRLKGTYPPEAPAVYPLLQMFFTIDGEWIIWSQRGFYDASLNGDQLVGFYVNRGEENGAEFYPSDRFSNTLFRPDVIREIIKRRSEPETLKHFKLDGIDIESILPPKIHFEGDTHQITDGQAFSFEFAVEHPQTQPLTNVWILENDFPLWEWQADAPGDVNPSADLVRFQVKDLMLLPGVNKLKIMARTSVSQSNPLWIEVFSRMDIASGEARNFDPSQPAPSNQQKTVQRVIPSLYVISIGVSNYKYGKERPTRPVPNSGDLYHLNYAAKDAEAIHNLLKQLKGQGFQEVYAKLLTDAQATKRTIEAEIKAMRQTLDERARLKRKHNVIARDVVVVFLAGHGYQLEDEFYFFGHDTVPQLDQISRTAVKLLKLGEDINRYQAEVIILTDACHSGLVGNNFNNREMTKSWKEINGRPQVIFSATTADHISVEHAQWGHGAFTKGILDVLNEERDRWLFQFFPDVSALVRSMTNPMREGKGLVSRMQRPTLSILGVMDDFKLRSKG